MLFLVRSCADVCPSIHLVGARTANGKRQRLYVLTGLLSNPRCMQSRVSGETAVVATASSPHSCYTVLLLLETMVPQTVVANSWKQCHFTVSGSLGCPKLLPVGSVVPNLPPSPVPGLASTLSCAPSKESHLSADSTASALAGELAHK